MKIGSCFFLFLCLIFTCQQPYFDHPDKTQTSFLPEQRSEKEKQIDLKLAEIDDWFFKRKSEWVDVHLNRYYTDGEVKVITVYNNGCSTCTSLECFRQFFLSPSCFETGWDWKLEFVSPEAEQRYISELEAYMEETEAGVPRYNGFLLDDSFKESVTEDERYFYTEGVTIDKFDTQNADIIKYFAGERENLVVSKGAHHGIFYRLWPKGKSVRYMISPLLTKNCNNIKQEIDSALKLWSDPLKEFLKFEYRPYDGKNLTEYALAWRRFNGTLFTKAVGGSYSYNLPIAYSLHSKVNIYQDASISTIAHETGHLLGLVHEHQRPDRDDYIENSPNWKFVPFNMGKFSHLNFYMTKEYDYMSIMHYPMYYLRKDLTGKADDLLAQESIDRRESIRNDGPTDEDLRFLAQMYGHQWKSSNGRLRIINFYGKNYYSYVYTREKDTLQEKILTSPILTKDIFSYEEYCLIRIKKFYGQTVKYGFGTDGDQYPFEDSIQIPLHYGKNSFHIESVPEDKSKPEKYLFTVNMYHPIIKNITLTDSQTGQILCSKDYPIENIIQISGFSGDKIDLKAVVDDPSVQEITFSHDGINFETLPDFITGFNNNILTRKYIKVTLKKAKQLEKIYELNFYKIDSSLFPERFEFKNTENDILLNIAAKDLSGINHLRFNEDEIQNDEIYISVFSKPDQTVFYGLDRNMITDQYENELKLGLVEGSNPLFIKVSKGEMYFIYQFNIEYIPMVTLTVNLDRSGCFIADGKKYTNTTSFRVEKGGQFQFEIPEVTGFVPKICRDLVNYDQSPKPVNEVKFRGGFSYQYENIENNDSFYIDYFPSGYDRIQGWVTVAPLNGNNYYSFSLRANNRNGVAFVGGKLYFLKGKNHVLSAIIEKSEKMANWQYSLAFIHSKKTAEYLKGYSGGNKGLRKQNIEFTAPWNADRPGSDPDDNIRLSFFEYGIAGEDYRSNKFPITEIPVFYTGE